jgi:amino acid permease
MKFWDSVIVAVAMVFMVALYSYLGARAIGCAAGTAWSPSGIGCGP